jgi:methionine-rich copper-binding protein CopC
VLTGAHAAVAADPCAPLINAVACENSKAGSPSSTWSVTGSGSSAIQGFATQMSVNLGETESFKVSTTASSYRLDIYRMGYYGGTGARFIGSVNPVGRQTQPSCLVDNPTLLQDCGNWAVSASWTVPTTAVSGIYFAKLVRTDGTSGASQVFFVVRDDASHSDMLVQTSDTTWQAYNDYGIADLYGADSTTQDRAYKVSYNRPFTTRDAGNEDFVFEAEYPMVRFLESNGYDLSYMSGADVDRRGALLKNHKVFMSVGHDEYWSGGQRANVEAARDAGVNLAFFSGNEMFWKTRWENSIDGSGTPYRTLVCYKETHENRVFDPKDPPTWTGSWRDPRFSPPADGGRPENAVTGTIFRVNSGTQNLQVPAADGKMRLWRDTSVASLAAGTTATLGSSTVGYEWDVDWDNGFRPPGLIDLSHTTGTNLQVLVDWGSNYDDGATATHSITLYRAASGALVFGAGTTQWSWGLDSTHDLGIAGSAGPASLPMQQATVNLFADMGVQPGTLRSGLIPATKSTDTTGPTVVVNTPTGGALGAGQVVTVSGTASDVGGIVAGVEVSGDGGATWHPATGRTSWTYTWTVGAPNSTTALLVRAIDDSANIGTAASIPVTVGAPNCPCSIWPNSTTPTTTSEPDPGPVELGVRFRADVAGKVTGVRFYKGSGNTGTHVGHLWSNTGQLLASVTFTGESASGWQQATFSTPVTVTAGTTYVVSYYAPAGHYSDTLAAFGTYGVDRYPLHALSSWTDGVNGLYHYGAGGGFPSDMYDYSNYYVDALFTPTGPDTTPPTVTAHTPASGATGISTGTAVTATFSEAVQPATIAMSLTGPNNVAVSGTTAYDSTAKKATFTPSAALSAGATYTATVSGAKDLAGNTMATVTWTFTTATPPTCPCTIWPSTATPAVASEPDLSAVELGVKFRSDVGGQVTGVRFYKGSGNTGTHVGHLWTSTGQLLASVTFTGESASGWQQATFSTPVTITAGTTYVVSYYAPAGHYADTVPYFQSGGFDRSPLHALADGQDGGNGVYRYGTGGGFPSLSWDSSNYWVDVVFTSIP